MATSRFPTHCQMCPVELDNRPGTQRPRTSDNSCGIGGGVRRCKGGVRRGAGRKGADPGPSGLRLVCRHLSCLHDPAGVALGQSSSSSIVLPLDRCHLVIDLAHAAGAGIDRDKVPRLDANADRRRLFPHLFADGHRSRCCSACRACALTDPQGNGFQTGHPLSRLRRLAAARARRRGSPST